MLPGRKVPKTHFRLTGPKCNDYKSKLASDEIRLILADVFDVLYSDIYTSAVDTCLDNLHQLLRRNLYSCPQEVKEAAYKGLVRPVLDYGSSVWDPPGVVLQVRKRAKACCKICDR